MTPHLITIFLSNFPYIGLIQATRFLNLASNQLLESIPAQERDLFAPDLASVVLQLRDVLYEPDELIRHVYFPVDCVVSLITSLEGGGAINTGTVGSEGIVGLPLFLGVNKDSMRALVQAPGQALRMDGRRFLEHLPNAPGLRTILSRYTQVAISTLANSLACNRLHSVVQRCAKWLLMVGDRVEGDEFFVTQEFLSQMLGVQRPTVARAELQLRTAGLISYQYGRMTLLNRPGLEATACECYRVLRQKSVEIFGASPA